MPTYKNKRNTWYCTFYFTDWQGKRRRKKKEGFKTKREAQAWERKFLEHYAETPNISFTTLAAAYKKHHQNNTRPATHYVKASIIDNHILPYFSHMTVDKITKQHIAAWKNKLLEKKLQPLYARQIYTILKSIFSFAIEHYNLPASPCPSRELFGTPRKRMDYWTLAEFRQFAMTLTRPRYIMAFYMLFWMGLRCGELLALTWDDVDFAANSISVSKSLVRLHRESIITPGKTKTSQRVVIMPAFLTAMLKDFQELTSGHGSQPLFSCSRSALNYTMHHCTTAAKVKKIRIHDLRHSHASLLINHGFQPIDVADRLGHANPAMTLSIYSHFYDSKRVSLAEKLNTIN